MRVRAFLQAIAFNAPAVLIVSYGSIILLVASSAGFPLFGFSRETLQDLGGTGCTLAWLNVAIQIYLKYTRSKS